MKLTEEDIGKYIVVGKFYLGILDSFIQYSMDHYQIYLNTKDTKCHLHFGSVSIEFRPSEDMAVTFDTEEEALLYAELL